MKVEELYKQRKELCTETKKKAEATIKKLLDIKTEIEKQYIEKAKGDALAYFNSAYSREMIAAVSNLDQAELELRLLRCPNDNQHQKPEGQYYRCDTCGYVFDDTSPAHL